MKEIDARYRDLLEMFGDNVSDNASTGEGSSFRVYKDRSYIGFKMLNSLIEKRNSSYTKNGHEYKGFYLNERNKSVGLLSQLYGVTGLFTLINRFDVLKGIDKDDVKTDELIAGIKSALLDVLDSVESNGYDLNPFLDTKLNNELFHDGIKNVNYIGAMTWALSLFVSARNAIRHESPVFAAKNAKSEKDNAAWVAGLKQRLNKQIKFIINFFLDNIIDKRVEDKPGSFGWGYSNGCSEASLFFTYSVIEAYSDFEDNVLGEDPDTELLDYLNEGISGKENRLEERYKVLCYEIGDVTWKAYKPYLRNYFFSDKFDGTVSVISKEEVLNSSRSSVLFNSIYVVFILIYSYMNVRKERYDIPGAIRTDEEREEIIKTMTRTLQHVQNFYADLKDEGKESIVDRHIISFNQPNELIKDFGKILNEESIQASSLLPMLVKAHNMIAYWILKFPQQTMTELFDEILEAKSDDDWTWEKRKFDLLSTERYIEAIGDYFDYYNSYEMNYAQNVFDAAQMRKEANQLAQKRYKAKFDKDLEQKQKEIREEAFNSVETEIRSEYIIENALTARMKELAEKTVNDAFEQKLESLLINISAYNEAENADKINVPMDAIERRLMQGITNCIASFLFDGDDMNDASLDNGEVSLTKIKDAVLFDLKKFRKIYLDFVARYCKKDGDKPMLADIFDIIKQKSNILDGNKR